jgi:alpha-amylase
VGNFGWVIEDVYGKAYEPMIGALERHPGIRLALHYTGPLLEWMATQRPDAIERLRSLVARDQIEIVGGGMFEPILVSLPVRDRVGQLRRMRDELTRLFGTAPRGAWLAERVWEPSLPADLAAAGYEYTVLDDNHFRGAFVDERQMWGSYTTDDQGRQLTVFGTDKELRDATPWKTVDFLIDYLRANATEDGERVGIMGDDGEKFGAWPGTYELCWSKEEWVERCFTALEDNASWITMVTPSDWLDEHDPIGRIYVPTSSYVEMTEWALPADEQPVFHHLRETAERERLPEARFLRGAMWRNFQVRYREVNELHKQMLRVSDAVEALPPGEVRDGALDHLYRGQSNDCYWHGWFGGIYIVHMRMATLAELIAAEDLALADRVLAGAADYDLDGVDEVAIGTAGQTVIVDVADGGGISSWDLRATRLALASVLRRRPEPYHQQILEAAAGEPVEELADPGADDAPPDRSAAQDLSKLIVYDDHERRSGLTRIFDSSGAAVGDFDRGTWTNAERDVAWTALSRSADDLHVRKEIGVQGGRLDGVLTLKVTIENLADRTFEGSLELEWNINLLGGGANRDAFYRSAFGRLRHDSSGSVEPGAALSMGNDYEGASISVSVEPPATQEWFPVETVSNSESGFEKVYQGSCLNQRWPLSVAPGEAATFSTTMSVSQTRDRRAEEQGDFAVER